MQLSARRCLLAVLALSLAAPAAAIDIRTVAQQGSAPKFVAIEQDGKARIGGLCVDIMRAIEGVDPELRFVGDQQWQPLIRAEAGVAAGSLDAACGLIRTPEREAKFGFIDTPLFPISYLLAVRADDTVEVANWQDVRALGERGVVLTMHGYSGILSYLRSVGGLRIDAGGRDSRINLEKLLAGRGRFYIHRSPGIVGEIASSGLQDKVRILPTVMHTENFYLMVAKAMAPDVKDRLNRALQQLAASGELARLSRKWAEH